MGKKTPWKEIFGVPFCMIFFGMWSLPQILRHKYQSKMDPRDCLHEKINFDRGNKKLRRKGNLWMLATLASQIPILSFGVASAWIGIFWSHSVRSKNCPFLLSFLLPLSKLDISKFYLFVQKKIAQNSVKCAYFRSFFGRGYYSWVSTIGVGTVRMEAIVT